MFDMLNPSRVLLLSLIGLVVQQECRADDYQFGQGVPVGSDFLFSGYANVVMEAPKGGSSQLAIDDLSLFVSGRVNQWINPFLEAEIAGLSLAKQGNGPKSGGRFVLERFYNDIQLTNSDVLRVGKMLAPVGDWNLIHAAPLVSTITRPLTTQRGYSEYASGASWLHKNAFGGQADWQLYWQPGNELYQRPESIAPRRYRDVWGAHVNWSMGLADKIGVSFQHGQLAASEENYTLIGGNVRKTFGALVLESEAISSRQSGGASRAHDREWGYYGLADYAFTPSWHGIVEAEHYQDHLRVERSKNTLIGIAYKPEPAVVWKVEYVHQTGVSPYIPTGWFASLSVLF